MLSVQSVVVSVVLLRWSCCDGFSVPSSSLLTRQGLKGTSRWNELHLFSARGQRGGNVISSPSSEELYSSSTAKEGEAQTSSSSSSSSSSVSIPTVSKPSGPSRLRQLKEAMWVRECLEDLTAAEFACSLSEDNDDDDEAAKLRKKKRKRAVDYDNLLTKLNERLVEMGCSPGGEEEGEECTVLSDDAMGAIAYSKEERQTLLARVFQTRVMLMETMLSRGDADEADDDGKTGIKNDPFSSLSGLLGDTISSKLKEQTPEEDGIVGPKLYVRDDGTVDWDGALQDRAALQNFGAAVWARINGQDPGTLMDDEEGEDERTDDYSDSRGSKREVVAKIEETEAIRELKARMDQSTAELHATETKHLALLNSALKVGQAVANIQMATLQPELRNSIRASADELKAKQEEVSLITLQYELERIFTYLMGEMNNNKGYVPLQDRLSVAEFGLLESQLEAMSTQEKDADVLQVLSDQVTDLKRRLGIDYYVTGLTYDREAIQRWMMELYIKSKQGLAFYVKGCQLFWNDIVFCSSLVLRALQGYTLKPREVRTLRRTFKDVINFVPFVIILIIPLSPVGHVLVFGAIQRVFPDFFPSCFTERRQNLLQLYESTEYTEVTIKENWREKFLRLLEAFGFLIVNSIRKLFQRSDSSDE